MARRKSRLSRERQSHSACRRRHRPLWEKGRSPEWREPLRSIPYYLSVFCKVKTSKNTFLILYYLLPQLFILRHSHAGSAFGRREFSFRAPRQVPASVFRSPAAAHLPSVRPNPDTVPPYQSVEYPAVVQHATPEGNPRLSAESPTRSFVILRSSPDRKSKILQFVLASSTHRTFLFYTFLVGL